MMSSRFIIFNKNTADFQNKSPCTIRSPAVPPPLLVPLSLSVSVPSTLSLSLAARPAAVTFTLPLALSPAAHHRLRPPQEVVHTHVVVVLHDGKKEVRCDEKRR